MPKYHNGILLQLTFQGIFRFKGVVCVKHLPKCSIQKKCVTFKLTNKSSNIYSMSSCNRYEYYCNYTIPKQEKEGEYYLAQKVCMAYRQGDAH